MTAPTDGISDYDNTTAVVEGGTTSPTFTAASYVRYKQIGKTVTGYFYGVLATAGSGVYGITLPVAPRDGFQPVGFGLVIDVSDDVKPYVCLAAVDPSGAAAGSVDEASVLLTVDRGTYGEGNNPVSSAAPFTFAEGDIISFSFDYEAD